MNCCERYTSHINKIYSDTQFKQITNTFANLYKVQDIFSKRITEIGIHLYTLIPLIDEKYHSVMINLARHLVRLSKVL